MNAEKAKFATEPTENAEIDIFKKNLLGYLLYAP